MTYEQWLKVININLNGIFLTDIAAGKYMLENGGGSIINTASMSAYLERLPRYRPNGSSTSNLYTVR